MVKQPLVLSVLFRQLAAAQRRGLPAHEVASVLAQDPQWRAAERNALARGAEALRSHALLSAALAQVPELVGPETAQLLRAAEAANALSATLDALADDYRHLADGSRDMRLALAWPLTVAAVVVVVLVVMSIFVVPAFQEAYGSFNADLPPQTALFFTLASALGRTWWLWGAVLAGLLVAWRLGKLPRPVVDMVARVWHGVGFVRHHLLSRFVVRLLRWLRLGAADRALGVAALAHLQATEAAASTARAAEAVAAGLRNGAGTAAALSQAPLLPARLALLVQLGERMDDVPAAIDQLAELADAQELEASQRFERACLLSLYGAIGVTVLATLVAVYLPIFKLGAIV